MLTKLPTLLSALLLSISGFGCQCCCLTEPWNDFVDCTSDIEPSFDCLYCPCLDLTRINRADGCLQCSCRCPAPVVHTPIYTNRWADPPGPANGVAPGFVPDGPTPALDGSIPPQPQTPPPAAPNGLQPLFEEPPAPAPATQPVSAQGPFMPLSLPALGR